MEPPQEVTGHWLSFKVPPQVLVAADDPTSAKGVAESIRKKFAISRVQPCSLEEVAPAVRSHAFDILFFSHENWEKGVLLYERISQSQASYCQLILFLHTSPVPRPAFFSHVNAANREKVDAVLQAADWADWDRITRLASLS